MDYLGMLEDTQKMIEKSRNYLNDPINRNGTVSTFLYDLINFRDECYDEKNKREKND